MMNAEHKCPTVTEPNPDFSHKYGCAFDTITYEGGDACWGADNGEYRTAISFCPWCGMKLPVPPVAGETITVSPTPKVED